MSPAWACLAIGCAALGVGLLRFAWGRDRGGLTAAGWLALASAAFAWHAAGASWGKAAALTVIVPSLCALPVLAASVEWRGRRKRSARHIAAPSEPSAAPRAALERSIARALIAGPAALAAALGLAAAMALRAPWLEADRLVAAGFLLPLAWAAGAIWAMMDDRLLRVAAALLAAAAIGFGGAIL